VGQLRRRFRNLLRCGLARSLRHIADVGLAAVADRRVLHCDRLLSACWLAFNPRQRAMAARVPLEWLSRRGVRGLPRQSQLSVRATLLMTKRKPTSIGEILIEEFMKPLALTQGDLAEAMGVPRKHGRRQPLR
jgi:hypothetical protein